MKVDDFITDVGEVLQEDFTYAPLWTREQLLGFTRQALREMAFKTALVDKSRMFLVGGSTGEFSTPADFHSGYYLQFNRAMVDIVKYGDLEFVSQTWALAATDTTPLAATVFGSGDNATIRLVPVPSTVTGAFESGVLSTVTVGVAGATWTVTCTDGELITTAGAGSPVTVVIRGLSGTQWTLSANAVGELTTTADVGSTITTVYLTDTSTGEPMDVYATVDGRLVTKSLAYGVITRLLLGTTTQSLTTGTNSSNAEYGVLVDLYAMGVSTTPEHTARLSGPVGEVVVTRTADYAAELWYKSTFDDVTTVEGELFLSTPFLAILKHRVLSMAYECDCDGQDLIKAKVLNSLFDSECLAMKRMFNRE